MKTAILASIIALILVTFFIESRADGLSTYNDINSGTYDNSLLYLQNQRDLNEQRRQTGIMEEQLKQQEESNDRQKEEDFRRDVRRILENDE